MEAPGSKDKMLKELNSFFSFNKSDSRFLEKNGYIFGYYND